MLVLRSSPASPFGRKVKIAARLLDLADRIEVVVADTTNEADPLRRQNPLGKIPTLVLENGTALYDSRVILEYLDHLAGGGRIIPTDGSRFAALTLQALADGIMDAGILRVYESRWRAAERQDERWLAHQSGKIQRALASIDRAPPAFGPMPDVGHIALACALGYLDLRFPGSWRQEHPRLEEWLERFASAVPAYAETQFKG